MISLSRAHVEEDMGMVERRQRTDAHELPRSDLDDGGASVVVEMGNDQIGHDTLSNPVAMGRTIAADGIKETKRKRYPDNHGKSRQINGMATRMPLQLAAFASNSYIGRRAGSPGARIPAWRRSMNASREFDCVSRPTSSPR